VKVGEFILDESDYELSYVNLSGEEYNDESKIILES